MKCDWCNEIENLFDAQYAMMSQGLICEKCAKEQGMVYMEVKFPDLYLEAYFPGDWCARAEGQRKSCPDGVQYCGHNDCY